MIKQIDINGVSFSKIICGSNPFYGFSHFSHSRSSEYLERFGQKGYLEEMIRFCLSLGINTIESCANEKIGTLISEFRNETSIKFIGTTRIDDTSEMKSHQQKLNYLIHNKADLCVIHSQFVDRPGNGHEIKGLKRMVDKIHEEGLLAGISTHRISTVQRCEDMNYGIDAYMFPFNKTGYVYPGYDGNETMQQRMDFIQKTEKPFIIMKSLAAGRIPPAEGLKFVLDHMKENDMITLGLGSIKEAEETEKILSDYYRDLL